jgi:hypothetical protein
MMREHARNGKVDRTGWPAGPWDNEPDFAEWTTATGYPAFIGRLPDGCWYGIVEAPYPIEDDRSLLLAFLYTIRDKTRGKLSPGMVGKTDQEGIGEYTYSMEHYQSPIPKSSSRGPYKTLEDVKQHCEDAAEMIRKTHEEGTYVNYFQPRNSESK